MVNATAKEQYLDTGGYYRLTAATKSLRQSLNNGTMTLAAICTCYFGRTMFYRKLSRNIAPHASTTLRDDTKKRVGQNMRFERNCLVKVGRRGPRLLIKDAFTYYVLENNMHISSNLATYS